MSRLIPVIALWVFSFTVAAAQQPAVVATDDGATLHRLSENVYAIIHADATDEWPHGNTGVIVGRSSVFVLDSTYLPSRARADIALIRRVTDVPATSRRRTGTWTTTTMRTPIARRFPKWWCSPSAIRHAGSI